MYLGNSYEVHMKFIWSSYEIPVKYEARILTNFLWSSFLFDMKLIEHSCEVNIKCIWNSCEILGGWIWWEVHLYFMWTSYRIRVRFIWNWYELLMNFWWNWYEILCTYSYEFCMKFVFISYEQRPGLVYQAISYWQNHARMANSQNVAISGEISSAILNIRCRFIGEKVFEIINSQKSHANWICYDGWTPLDQPRFGFPVGEVPTCTWRFNSLLPIMTP